MRILGFQKTTLLDYPHKIASTLFVGGCNFRCPYCHNGLLVTKPNEISEYSIGDILSYFQKRTGILEGVCITGGEPTLYPELPELIRSIKSLGLQVKLDSNGTKPQMLEALLNEGLIDYVAMDIKNSPNNYSKTVGVSVDLEQISQSIALLASSHIPYEFRTTVVRELHTLDDFIKIGQWIDGAPQYYLQNFVDSDHILCPGQFTSYDKSTLESFRLAVAPYVGLAALRGVD